MSYLLGIDVGTTRTAAAIGRLDARPGEIEIVNLGDRASAVPSVLYVGDDGSAGRGRGRRAPRRDRPGPRRARVQAPHRRPDPAGRRRPAVGARGALGPAGALGGRPGGRARGRAGRPDRGHAPGLVGRRTRRNGSAARSPGRACRSSFLAEPQAAALHYAAAERVEPGSTIAVYDLGGGTFDAAVVHKDGARLHAARPPRGRRAARRHRLRRGRLRARRGRRCRRRSRGSTRPIPRCCRRSRRSGASAWRPRRRSAATPRCRSRC